MRFLSASIIIASLSALAAAPAHGIVCQHQPGQGAIDQYCEIIPSGAGERPDRTGGGGGRSATSIPEAIRKELRAAGADGRVLAALARTSPAPQLSERHRSEPAPSGENTTTGEGGSSSSTSAAAAPSSGTLHALVGDIDGTGGRSWLPWVLVAITAGVGLAAWLRRGRWS